MIVRSSKSFGRALLLLCLCSLAACTAERDSYLPPFARVPYEPISRDAIVSIALREWRLFGSLTDGDEPAAPQAAPPMKAERQDGLWQRVGEYWWLGLDHPSRESRWTGKHDETGRVFPPYRDNDFPWSAAFVSYVMRIAGAGARFPYAPDHAHYIDIAKNQVSEPASRWMIVAERPDAYAPKPGDLVCQGREEASNLGFDDLPVGHYFPAHCDIVVDISQPLAIFAVGGNEHDAVTKRRIPTTADGKLAPSADSNWLAVIRLVDVPDKPPVDQASASQAGP